MLKQDSEDRELQQRPPTIFGDLSPFFDNRTFNKFFDIPKEDKQQDLDLDSVIKTKEDFNEMYMQSHNERRQAPHSDNNISRIRVWSHISGDGKVEERRTVDDGNGNRLETITKSIGDSGYTVEKNTTGDGSIEIDEKYNNMTKVNTAPTSKDDKEYFEERWSQPTVDPKGREFPEQIDDDTKRIFRNLFGEGFPGFGRK